MNRKNLPLLLMLSAGAVTCIITYIEGYSTVAKLVSLFVVLLLFFLLGSVLKWTLDYFDRQNEEKLMEEGEVIEKAPEEMDAAAEGKAMAGGKAKAEGTSKAGAKPKAEGTSKAGGKAKAEGKTA